MKKTVGIVWCWLLFRAGLFFVLARIRRAVLQFRYRRAIVYKYDAFPDLTDRLFRTWTVPRSNKARLKSLSYPGYFQYQIYSRRNLPGYGWPMYLAQCLNRLAWEQHIVRDYECSSFCLLFVSTLNKGRIHTTVHAAFYGVSTVGRSFFVVDPPNYDIKAAVTFKKYAGLQAMLEITQHRKQNLAWALCDLNGYKTRSGRWRTSQGMQSFITRR